MIENQSIQPTSLGTDPAGGVSLGKWLVLLIASAASCAGAIGLGDFAGQWNLDSTRSDRIDQAIEACIANYPADVKAFYMEPDPKDARYALCVDVLAPEGYGEIIGGSQRVSSYELLNSRIEQHNLPKEAFQWYLDLRRYGSVPHSGFGMGIERAVAWICGLDHVRETIPFARTLHRIYP